MGCTSFGSFKPIILNILVSIEILKLGIKLPELKSKNSPETLTDSKYLKLENQKLLGLINCDLTKRSLVCGCREAAEILPWLFRKQHVSKSKALLFFVKSQCSEPYLVVPFAVHCGSLLLRDIEESLAPVLKESALITAVIFACAAFER